MKSSLYLLLGLLGLAWPRHGQAQSHHLLRPDSTLVEPDQEVDLYAQTRYNAIHYITPELRGVSGVDEVVFWVSPNGRQLSAFRGHHHLWTTDLAQAFQRDLPAASIQTLTLSTGYVFVCMGLRGFAAVDRRTGRITDKKLD